MNTFVQHAFDLVIEGVLMQLPAQLIGAAIVGAAVPWMRKRKKSRAQGAEAPADPGANTSRRLLQASTSVSIHAEHARIYAFDADGSERLGFIPPQDEPPTG
ncbi:hypothetical protein ACIRL3_46045 [Streptomyces sp. NPDC102384]|uniref:hypothetical protein n=1 Tax=unclassified Streptomyces TaxID=2593676 RepID=UPI003820366E